MTRNYNKDIVPPINEPTYNGPDRRYYQHFFVGMDNRNEGYVLIRRYNTANPAEKGLLINLEI